MNIPRVRLSVLAALPLVLGLAALPARADEAPKLSPQILDAVVKLRAQVPSDARTAPFLGTEREGSGVLIDSGGLIVTIGYLITEAMGVEVTAPGGKPVPATVVGFDSESGLGLVRANQKLEAKPLPLGSAKGLKEKQPVLIAAFGGVEGAQPAVVVSRRPFAGYWEYLLDEAIFTAPPHLNWSGSALIAPDGKLLGIGSLIVGDAKKGDKALPGNMFVPIDLLKPNLGDLLASGRPAAAPRPWLGINAQEVGGRIVVTRISPEGPAEKAGILRGDTLRSIGGRPVNELADLWQRLWAQGPAGTEIRLGISHGGSEPRDVTVKTIDRYRYLKLDTTY
jgi:S1-C subfamily serine protease